MREHRTIVLLPLLVLASVVAACGDDDDVGAADVEEVQDVGETDIPENAADTRTTSTSASAKSATTATATAM